MKNHAGAGWGMLRGTVAVFVAEGLLLPTGLVTVAFLAHRFGPANYGVFSLAAAVVSWLEWGITSAFSRPTIKFVSEAADWRPAASFVLRFHLATSVGAAAVLWLSAGPLARALHEPALIQGVRLFAFDIPIFSLAQAHRHILIAVGAFKERALASAVRWVARVVLIVVLVELGLSVPGAILGSIGASLAELLIARAYIRPPLFLWSRGVAGGLWGYAMPLLLATVSMRVYDKVDLFMLKLVGGTTVQAGLYAAAQNLTLAIAIFALAFSPLLLSTLSRLVVDGDPRGAKALGRDAMRLAIGLLPLVGAAAGAGPEIVRLVFGATFLPAAPLVGVLMLEAVSLFMISVTTAILTAAGKPHWVLAATGPLVPLAIGGYLLVIPRLGPLGAALVATSCATVGATATILAVSRVWRSSPPLSTLARSTLMCGGAYALASGWPTPGGAALVLKLMVIALLAPVGFLVLGEFGRLPLAAAELRARWPRPAVRGAD